MFLNHWESHLHHLQQLPVSFSFYPYFVRDFNISLRFPSGFRSQPEFEPYGISLIFSDQLQYFSFAVYYPFLWVHGTNHPASPFSRQIHGTLVAFSPQQPTFTFLLFSANVPFYHLYPIIMVLLHASQSFVLFAFVFTRKVLSWIGPHFDYLNLIFQKQQSSYPFHLGSSDLRILPSSFIVRNLEPSKIGPSYSE